MNRIATTSGGTDGTGYSAVQTLLLADADMLTQTVNGAPTALQTGILAGTHTHTYTHTILGLWQPPFSHSLIH